MAALEKSRKRTIFVETVSKVGCAMCKEDASKQDMSLWWTSAMDGKKIQIRDAEGRPVERAGVVATVYTKGGCDVWFEAEGFGGTWFAGDVAHTWRGGDAVACTLSDEGPGRVATIRKA